MALGTSDYLQQQLLAESKKMNDNLTPMKEALIEISKKTGKGSGNSNTPPSRGPGAGNKSSKPKGQAGSVLGDIMGEIGNFGKLNLSNSATISTAVSSIGKSAGVLGSSFLKLGGPIGMAAGAFMQVAEAGVKVYEYLNAQLELYQDLNSSGVTLNDGILSLRKGASNAMMSMDGFSKVLKGNSMELASMNDQYGDGAAHFGNLLNTVQMAQNQVGLYGISQQQIADITAKNYKIQKLYGSSAQMRDLDESQSTQKYIGNLNYMSKVMGTSVDELMKKVKGFTEDAETANMQQSLGELYNLPEKLAGDVVAGLSTTLAGLGKGGDVIQKAYSSFLNLGSISDELAPGGAVLTKLFSGIRTMNKNGVTSVQEYNKYIKGFTADQTNMRSLVLARRDAIKMGNTAAANQIQAIIETGKMMADPTNNPRPFFEDMMTKFNNWMGNSIMKPFNTWMNGLAETTAKYLMGVADNTDSVYGFMSTLFKDAYDKLAGSFVSLFDGVLYIPHKLLGFLGGGQWADKIIDSFKGVFEFVLQIPQRIIAVATSLLFGSDEEIRGSIQDLKGTFKNVFSGIANTFSQLGDIKFNYDDMKTRINDAFDSMKSTIGGWWDKAKGWFSDEDPTKGKDKPTNSSTSSNKNELPANVVAANNAKNPAQSTEKKLAQEKITAKPEYTAPTKLETDDVQTASNDSPVDQPNSDLDEIIKALRNVVNNTSEATEANKQVASLLRQISENTEPARNT